MQRRAILAIASGLSLGLVGCIESVRDPGTPQISVNGSEIEQDDQSVIAVETKNIESLELDSGPVASNTGIQFHFDRAEYSHSPDTTQDSFPPTMHWSSPTNVSLEIPVTAVEENPPGEYQYTISVSNDSVLHGGASSDAAFTITVTETE